ncbi:MAG: hypothetical protein KAS36_02690 [Anaerolineales bacterium]|nr:hypothetical protein [Anaerolineales bacterium]
MKLFKDIFNKNKEDQSIVVVSGLPRSGTSMMMKMLEAGGIPPMTDKIRTADDDNPKGYYEFERVKKLKEGDTAWLDDAHGKAVKVISALLTYLPVSYNYNVIFMERALPEVLASQRKMLLNREEDPDKVSEEELTQLFQKHLNQVMSWIESQPNVHYLGVNYNLMLQEPDPYVEQINQFLGDRLDVKDMAGVVDPKLYRQRNSKV